MKNNNNVNNCLNTTQIYSTFDALFITKIERFIKQFVVSNNYTTNDKLIISFDDMNSLLKNTFQLCQSIINLNEHKCILEVYLKKVEMLFKKCTRFVIENRTLFIQQDTMITNEMIINKLTQQISNKKNKMKHEQQQKSKHSLLTLNNTNNKEMYLGKQGKQPLHYNHSCKCISRNYYSNKMKMSSNNLSSYGTQEVQIKAMSTRSKVDNLCDIDTIETCTSRKKANVKQSNHKKVIFTYKKTIPTKYTNELVSKGYNVLKRFEKHNNSMDKNDKRYTSMC